jgi:hypothetical protein
MCFEPALAYGISRTAPRAALVVRIAMQRGREVAVEALLMLDK